MRLVRWTRSRAALHANLEASLSAGGDKMAQKARADLMLDNFLHNGTIDSVEEDYRVVSTALSRVTPERAFAEFHRVWSQSNGPLIVLVAGQAVPPEAVRKAWLEAQAAPKPTAPAEHANHVWAYTNFGPPGVVAHRERIDDIGASRIEFANGVRVNFKSIDNMQDKVFIRIRFGAGQAEIPDSESFTASVGALLLRSGGLGKNDFQDTVELCQTHACGLNLGLGRESFVLDGQTRVSDLDAQLQLMTAYLTDPAYWPEVDAQLPTVTDCAFRQLKVDPDAVASQALQDALREAKPQHDSGPRPGRQDDVGRIRAVARPGAEDRRPGSHRCGRYRRGDGNRGPGQDPGRYPAPVGADRSPCRTHRTCALRPPPRRRSG